MTVLTKRLQSEYGFETTGFVVSNGLLRVASLETTQLSLGGENNSISIVNGVVTINSKAGPSGSMNNVIIGSSTPASGSFTNLSVTTTVNFTTSGGITINPASVGAIDNIDIGLTIPGDAEFVDLTVLNLTATNGNISNAIITTANLTTLTVTNTTATNLTATNLTATTQTTNNLTATNITVDDIVINNQPSLPSHGTRRDYVDATATALAIALGG